MNTKVFGVVGNLSFELLSSWCFQRLIFCKDFYEDPSCRDYKITSQYVEFSLKYRPIGS